jgi:hypothetical protein
VEETGTSIGTVMLQGKKICMVKTYFIIRNIEITNKDFTSSIISVSYDAFASLFRKNIFLERILESGFLGQRRGDRGDCRFVNPWMLVSRDPSKIPERLQ